MEESVIKQLAGPDSHRLGSYPSLPPRRTDFETPTKIKLEHSVDTTNRAMLMFSNFQTKDKLNKEYDLGLSDMKVDNYLCWYHKYIFTPQKISYYFALLGMHFQT